MGILEQVINMKKQGLNENEIIRNLQEQGITPREISDALIQSQIKKAVISENEESMQPSIMRNYAPEKVSEILNPQYYSDEGEEDDYSPQFPQTQNYSRFQSPYSQQEESYNEEYYPQETYSEEGYSESSIDNMIEIAEQVFSDKMKKVQNQIKELLEFKAIHDSKVQNLSDRLKRIEKMFDRMQISIINKIGNYGKNLETLKKEVEMVEDSFSKVLDKKLPKKPSKKK